MSEHTSTPFRTVMRGYDPSEVDRHVAELSRAAGEARARAEQLSHELDETRQRMASESVQAEERQRAADTAKPAAEPTFHDFGKRVGQILAMAEEEAQEMTSAAVAEVDRTVSQAKQDADRTRAEADAYARETREQADSEAARIVEDAKRSADEMIDTRFYELSF